MTLSSAMTGEPLALGPIIVSRRIMERERRGVARPPKMPGGEFVTIYFPFDSGTDRSNDVYVMDDIAAPTGIAPSQNYIALLAPYRFLPGIPRPGQLPERMPRSVALRVLQRYLQGLLALECGRLCDRQADFAANAVGSLLAAALVPSGADQGLGSRRRLVLRDRIIAYVDAHIAEPLSAESLCAALACSRSALYRATEGLGGVSEVIVSHRLTAIRDRLRDPMEQRPIVAIAQAYRFSDTAQFYRRFKALFGVPLGEIRRRAMTAGGAARRGRGIAACGTVLQPVCR